MVGKVEENLGVLVGLEDLVSNSGVTLEDTENGVLVGLGTLVVNVATSIDIDTWLTSLGWLVEKLTLVWVLG